MLRHMRTAYVLLAIVVAGVVALGVLALRGAGNEAARLGDFASRVGGAVSEGAHGTPGIRKTPCPRRVVGCHSARGPIVLVQRIDPDGDGDLHVVVAGGSITTPGFTSIDVRKGLRPRRDPRVGDLASAAGILQRGSYKQLQLHAREFHVRYR
jgi:hypothetical protein